MSSTGGEGGRRASTHGSDAAAEPYDHLTPASSTESAAYRTLRRAGDYLLSLQAAEGWWKGDLETNVTMNAEDILLRRFLGLRDPGVLEPTAEWIRAQQQPDGSWNTFYGGPPDLSTSVEAYAALRLAGDDLTAEHMKRAATSIRDQGGIAGTRIFTRIWLALFGWFPWERLPEVPPEIILLPRWSPVTIYSLASWARGTVVALSIVSALRPVRPPEIELSELHTDRVRRHPRRRRLIRPLRRHAMEKAARWIIDRQEADGCWGGIQPPTVYSILALHLVGYALDHPVMIKAVESLDNYSVRYGDQRMVEACQSPVWDTCLATIALTDAGTRRDHPQLLRAVDWLLDQEVRTAGDWAVRRPTTPPGGWAYEFCNETYPDTDDSAMVALALRRVRASDPIRRDAVVQRGIDWLWAMQSRNGGWGAFDVDNTQTLLNRLPLSDFGEVIDPPSADVTAHVVELLADVGQAHDPRLRRAIGWLLGEQEADGPWFGRWGANYIYGTGAVVPALVAAGIPITHRAVRRAVQWLQQHQNPDGGWGEDMRSYRDQRWNGRGTSTASQTAWALLALLAADERGAATERGIGWLTRTQREDGGWDEPQFTGTGFPGDFYLNYHLYRLVWPITALGRYVHRHRLGAGPAT